ncbi:MAG TPA: hypothetical protein VM120_28715 [Bryobacteraceae bacterium]|nr:hypothetical protein [Bryobacteraceae bacterium]
MLTSRKILVMTLIAVVAGAIWGTVGTRPRTVKAQNTRVPFTAQFEERFYDGAGSLVHVRPQTVAVQNDGSNVKVDGGFWLGALAEKRPKILEHRIIIDQQARTLISVYPDLKMKITAPLRVGELQSQRVDSFATCNRTGWELEASLNTTISGQPAIFMKRERLKGGDSWITREWVSPELGCIALKKEVLMTVNGAEQKSEVVLKSLRIGEPDPALFNVPRDFAETLPSKVLEGIEAFNGRQCSQCLKNTGSRADARYKEHWDTRQAEGK